MLFKTYTFCCTTGYRSDRVNNRLRAGQTSEAPHIQIASKNNHNKFAASVMEQCRPAAPVVKWFNYHTLLLRYYRIIMLL